MGATSSMMPRVGVFAPSVFVDDKLRQGETMMRINHVLRTSFVKYIKDCRWTGFIDSTDNNCIEKLPEAPSSSSSSTWAKFGYKSPHCSGAASTTNVEDSSKSPNSQPSEAVHECSSLLFHRNGLRAVVIAILLPHFLSSCGLGDTADSSVTEDWRNEDNTVRFYTQVKVAPLREDKIAPTKRGHVHDWLVRAVERFSKSELDEYMADPSASWIRDLLRALQTLPAAVTLSTVDVSKQESKIVYANFGGVGANMHEVCSADCSPGGAAQVTNAVFGAKKYKRCLTSYDGTCRLRALRPVFDAQNAHVYTLGLDSKPFKDPILELQDAAAPLSEETFQQIEDLLFLVPLLVRNLQCQ